MNGFRWTSHYRSFFNRSSTCCGLEYGHLSPIIERLALRISSASSRTFSTWQTGRWNSLLPSVGSGSRRSMSPSTMQKYCWKPVDSVSSALTRSAVFRTVEEFPAGTKLTLYLAGGYSAS